MDASQQHSAHEHHAAGCCHGGKGADAHLAKDPVCGMTVDPATAQHRAEHAGQTYYFCCAGCRAKFEHDPAKYLAPASAPREKDPVCGMEVDPATAKHRAEHAGRTYYFCSAGCRAKFASDPAKYLKPVPAPAAPVAAGATYTCPMHPEIRQAGPGSCPICGMALEPEIATAETGPNPELVDMTRRFWIGLVLAAPVVVLEMGAHLAGGHGWVDPTLSSLVQFAFATPVVIWAGWPFFQRGARSLATRNLNMFTLIALGTGVAYVYSLVAAFAPGIFPPAFRGHDGAVAVYFEAAAVITVLVLLGQVLELRARERTSGAIRALLGLAPTSARRLAADGSDEEDQAAAAAGKTLHRSRRRRLARWFSNPPRRTRY